MEDFFIRKNIIDYMIVLPWYQLLTVNDIDTWCMLRKDELKIATLGKEIIQKKL